MPDDIKVYKSEAESRWVLPPGPVYHLSSPSYLKSSYSKPSGEESVNKFFRLAMPVLWLSIIATWGLLLLLNVTKWSRQ